MGASSSTASSAFIDSARQASGRRSSRRLPARPSKRSRTVSSSPHSSALGMSGGGGWYLRAIEKSCTVRLSGVQAVMPTVPPGRVTRNISSAALRGRGGIIPPKNQPTTAKRGGPEGRAHAVEAGVLERQVLGVRLHPFDMPVLLLAAGPAPLDHAGREVGCHH